jgi:hypothetical protein
MGILREKSDLVLGLEELQKTQKIYDSGHLFNKTKVLWQLY